ncbi:hypothetical protein [Methylomonas sp. AM2-LC]|uniref:hypothetical protein n=1 Tax=Methylomonas sp. AM2-LC TaxID=3153301 RepID=UPI003262ED5B
MKKPKILYAQALKYVWELPESKRKIYVDRFLDVCNKSENVGWGVRDDMVMLLAEYGLND